MPVSNNKVSQFAAGQAKAWEKFSNESPQQAMNVAGELVKKSGKLIAPGVGMMAGGWATNHEAQEFIKAAILGQDGSVFHSSTSTSDRVLASVLHGVATGVAAGMTVAAAWKFVQGIAEAVEKSDG